MQKLRDLAAWAESRREFWLDLVRIYLGLGLFVRGLVLVFDIKTSFFINLVQRAGHEWLMSGLLLHYVIMAHFVGGALLVIGFCTRLAALVQIPVLAGAVFFVHRQEGLMTLGQSLEFSALVLFLLVVIFISGAGRLSLDRVVFGSRAVEVHAEPAPQI